MGMYYCEKCGKLLIRDEIAVTKKLINRGTSKWYCKECLAAYFEITVEDIDAVIDRFKRQGCTLFTQEY